MRGSIPGRVTGDFFRSIRQVHVPGVDSASKNEYQDIPGGKGDRCVGVKKSESLILLDPSRPRRPVTGILLPFTIIIHFKTVINSLTVNKIFNEGRIYE